MAAALIGGEQTDFRVLCLGTLALPPEQCTPLFPTAGSHSGSQHSVLWGGGHSLQTFLLVLHAKFTSSLSSVSLALAS